MKNVHKILALTAMLSLGATGALAEGSSNNNQSTSMQSGSSTDSTMQNRSSGSMDGNGMSPQSNMAPNTSASASNSTQVNASDVRNVQERLSNNGYSVSVDGVWGPQTASAIRDFQSDNDLSVTGRLDSQTISALELNRSEAGSQYN